jgi:hypothetical protein
MIPAPLTTPIWRARPPAARNQAPPRPLARHAAEHCQYQHTISPESETEQRRRRRLPPHRYGT